MNHNNTSSSDYDGLLNPPKAPFASSSPGGGFPRSISHDNLSIASGTTGDLSLSVNYLPSKFGSLNQRRRKGWKNDGPRVPKNGGGLDAFKVNEARMPQGKQRLRWNRFKWILFFSNALLSIYAVAALIVCLLTWFDVWDHADVIRVGNRPELIISTIASCIGIITSIIGWAGILLNNRSFLAWYTFLNWITFAFLVTPGYITYRKRTFNLEGKINAQWSRALGAEGRLRVQNQLECCGYFSPFVEATVSQTCYARTVLEGCKGVYLDYERFILKRWFAASFILVPVQIAVIVAGLLCSDHITYRFGKGMMPERYRLNLTTMAAIMENYANQLADQYGADIADDILRKTRDRNSGNVPSNDSVASFTMGSMGTPGGMGMGIGTGVETHSPMAPFHARYTSVGKGGPGSDSGML
ncbi:tetraspanin Tsp2 family [Gymnopilus junonius]|uniref:Tetraspanin Tsp2 family n=1 Tax=Gymnopilus junonius TaxID=109634 RepID=A0A9P5NE16_GYMJU|nr:tetraspanin Tsp2 family [Gymnopilus junonius]